MNLGLLELALFAGAIASTSHAQASVLAGRVFSDSRGATVTAPIPQGYGGVLENWLR